MAVVGEGSETAEMESMRKDNDGLVREKPEQQEEKPSMLKEEFEKMQAWGRETDSEAEKSTGITAAPSAAATAASDSQRDDVADGAERAQKNTSRLLYLTCQFDSTPSLSSLLEGVHVDVLDNSGWTALHHAAEHHSVRCIEFLLKRRAKTDVKSTKGLIALEVALQCERMQIISWSPAEKVSELFTLIRDKDLTAIKILASHTRDLAQVASRLIVRGNIIAFAALLSVTEDTQISTVLLSEGHGDATLFDTLVYKAISSGEQTGDKDLISDGYSATDEKHNVRQILLKELELFLHWYLDHDNSDSKRRVPPTASLPAPPMHAAQAGDIAVVNILLDNEADVNETDLGGNTALHWSVRASVNTRDIRLVLKLLRHGAFITMGNRLGLTPVHIAAGQGHLQALQILLAVEPSSVDITAETKETPLFSAVKGNHYDCVQLLLQHGASRQVLNLRKQRPIDVAETSDMRGLLSLQESSGRMKDVNSMRQPSTASLDTDYGSVAYDTEHLRFLSDNPQVLECSDESLKPLMPGKSEMCRYFSMPGGCVRGDKCFYAHREEELQGRARASCAETKQGIVPYNIAVAPARAVKRVSEDLSKKIFVGGLSPSVESDDLREFFEGKFGAVMDAIVIGNHAGDHVQSRGFGFVTFKQEESVIAAVQAHYVNIYGKKVEIKGAVPRSVLPPIEIPKGAPELSRPNSAESTRVSEVEGSKVLNPSSQELICPPKGDFQVRMMNYMGYLSESSAPPFKLSLNEEPFSTQGASSSVSPRSTCTTSQDATWISTFKQWLPKFLAEVSNRLKEGEWYPLSSLKGDFRATCGLELDHVAIGYHKLSDFVRSIPESCRMKIVPVGRGPATHMVLLPALPRLTPTLAVPPQTPKSTGPSACSSLVDAGRSYAAAACQLPIKSMMDSTVHSRSLRPHTGLPGSSVIQFEPQNAFSGVPQAGPILSRSHEDLRLPENFLSQHYTPVAEVGMRHDPRATIPKDEVGTPGTLMQEADVSNLRDLLALMDSCEGQHSRDRANVQGSSYLTRNNFNSGRPNVTPPGRSGMACANSAEALPDSRQEEPKTPVQQVNLRPFSAFNHPFTGFLPQDYINTSYSMWGQPLGQQIHVGQSIMNRNQGQQPVKPADQLRLWEDSPQSILQPHGRSYSQFGIHEAPRSVFSPAGSNSPESQGWDIVCVCCRERQSLWMAVPCNHLALCAVCKDLLHKLNRSTATCPVCANQVERWIALH